MSRCSLANPDERGPDVTLRAAADHLRRAGSADRAGRGVLGWIAGVQAAYYLATGLWPIVHLPSFLAVTGPKTDLWLVQSFGALVCVPGLALAATAVRGRVGTTDLIVALGSAATLALIDIVFVARGVIPAVYLLDAGVEAALLGGGSRGCCGRVDVLRALHDFAGGYTGSGCANIAISCAQCSLSEHGAAGSSKRHFGQRRRD